MKNKILILTQNSIIKSPIILLSIIYVISPIDVVPDVPPVGWTDDVIAILLTLFYCISHGEPDKGIDKVTDVLKWGTIGIITIMVCFIVLCVALIIHLLK